jgi:hypothetical protein
MYSNWTYARRTGNIVSVGKDEIKAVITGTPRATSVGEQRINAQHKLLKPNIKNNVMSCKTSFLSNCSTKYCYHQGYLKRILREWWRLSAHAPFSSTVYNQTMVHPALMSECFLLGGYVMLHWNALLSKCQGVWKLKKTTYFRKGRVTNATAYQRQPSGKHWRPEFTDTFVLHDENLITPWPTNLFRIRKRSLGYACLGFYGVLLPKWHLVTDHAMSMKYRISKIRPEPWYILMDKWRH